MKHFTAAICTYNGAERLPLLLDGLIHQNNPLFLAREILIVDNNSKDDTAGVCQRYRELLPPDMSLKYCFEPRQGLAFARQRAIEESDSELVGFLDDDNLPGEDWITEAYRFARDHPEAGAFGGKIAADFEVEPPEDFQKIACFLAIIDRGDRPFVYETSKKMLPPGAGLVVRRRAWLDNVPRRLFLTGRVGKSMVSSEDLEAIIYIQRAGWQVWYNPMMKITHSVPAYRLQKQYLLSLIKGVGLARYYIRNLRISPWQRPLLMPIYYIHDLLKLLFFVLHKKHKEWRKIVTECEIQFLVSTLISPFYLLLEYRERKRSHEL